MRYLWSSFVRLYISSFVLLTLIGCAGGQYSGGTTGLGLGSCVKAVVPESLLVRFEVANSVIVRDQIDGVLPPITVLERGNYIRTKDAIFVRLNFQYAGKCPDDERFYLVELPTYERGAFVRQANLVSFSPGGEFRSRMESFRINVEIRSGRVIGTRIEDFGERTVGLFVARWEMRDSQIVAIIQSRNPGMRGEQWAVYVPETDGEYKLVATRLAD